MSEKLGPRVFGHDHGKPFLGREFSSRAGLLRRGRRARSTTRSAGSSSPPTSRPRTSCRAPRGAHDDLRAPAQARDDRARAVRGAPRRQGGGGGLRPRRDAGRARAPRAAVAHRRARREGAAPAPASRPRRRRRGVPRARAPREAGPRVGRVRAAGARGTEGWRVSRERRERGRVRCVSNAATLPADASMAGRARAHRRTRLLAMICRARGTRIRAIGRWPDHRPSSASCSCRRAGSSRRPDARGRRGWLTGRRSAHAIARGEK